MLHLIFDRYWDICLLKESPENTPSYGFECRFIGFTYGDRMGLFILQLF